jgi:hypothetical protein
MRKLILLIILWAAVAYYFPDTRRLAKEWTRPLWVPVVEWNARKEMEQVGHDVVQVEAKTGKLPDQRRWIEWLDYRYPMGGMAVDPWGSMYQLEVWADSIAILSDGPDRVRGTEDDFHVTLPRVRHGN